MWKHGALTSETMLHLLLAALLFVQVDAGPIREDKKALEDDWFTRAIEYMKDNPETLEELVTTNKAVLEGDMVLSSDRNAVESMWPTLEIPYVISPELASRTDDIVSAMAKVSEHTCVSFHKRTSETNYLLFKTSKGCASYVGFIGGEQPVFIGPPCKVGNIIHEILHALGFHHEHTRTDREQHITILPHNIIPGMEKNFKKQHGETFDLPYDISSIMHYGRGFFSVNGLPTIVPSTDAKNMGQRVRMTETDIEKVRHLYNCDGVKKELKKESVGVEKTEDAHMFHSVVSALRSMNEGHVPANKPEEDHTLSSRQCLNAASRGRRDTVREQAELWLN